MAAQEYDAPPAADAETADADTGAGAASAGGFDFSEEAQARTVYVGGLDYRTTTKHLHEVFSSAGNILKAQIILDHDGRSRGYGFVQFEGEQMALEAIRQMHGIELDGRKITVSRAQRREPPFKGGGSYDREYDSYPGRGGRTGSVAGSAGRSSYRGVMRIGYRVRLSNLSTATTWRELKDFLREAGDVTYADVQTGGYGIGEYMSMNECMNAIRVLNGAVLQGATVTVKPLNFDPVSGERTDLDALGQPAVVGTRPPPYDSYGRGGSYSDRSFGDRGYSSRPGYPERDGERDRYYEREYSYGGSGGYGGDDRAYVPPERDYLPAERDYGAVDRYAPPGRSYPSRAAAAYDDYDDYPPSAGRAAYAGAGYGGSAAAVAYGGRDVARGGYDDYDGAYAADVRDVRKAREPIYPPSRGGYPAAVPGQPIRSPYAGGYADDYKSAGGYDAVPRGGYEPRSRDYVEPRVRDYVEPRARDYAEPRGREYDPYDRVPARVERAAYGAPGRGSAGYERARPY